MTVSLSHLDCDAFAITNGLGPVQAVEHYLSLGLRVLPVKPASKLPDRDDWTGVHFGAEDFTHRHNVGLKMGHGIVCIDLDGDVDECYRQLKAAVPNLPTTVSQRTPSGGVHLLFAYDGNDLSNWTHLLGKDRTKKQGNIDIRTYGGQIVVAPSYRKEGKYQWQAWPDEAGENPMLATLPQEAVDWLASRGGARKSRAASPPPALPAGLKKAGADVVERARRYVASMDAAISGSGGHSQTFQVAQVIVRGFGITGSDAVLLMQEYNQRCDPSWSDFEIEHKLRSAAAQGTMEFGQLRDASKPFTPKTQEQREEDFKATLQAAGDVMGPQGRKAKPAAPQADDWGEEGAVATGADDDPVAWMWDPCVTTGGITAHQKAIILRVCQPRRNLMTRRVLMGDKEWADGDVGWIKEAIEAKQPHWVPSEKATEKMRRPRKDEIRVNRDLLTELVGQLADASGFHPVCDYLARAAQEHDGHEDAAAKLASVLCGKADPFVASCLRLWGLGAVHRAMTPGCKMDYCLWLYGDEGAGKSGFGRALVPDESWCTQIRPSAMTGQFAFLGLQTGWLQELPEAEQHRRDLSAFKSFITTAVDEGLPKNSNVVVRIPRAFACYCTTNELSLPGDGAERRLLPIRVTGEASWNRITADLRDAFWGACMTSYQHGEVPDRLPSDMEREHARRIRELQSATEDPWADIIRDRLDGEGWPVLTRTILSDWLARPVPQQTKADEMRVSTIMRVLGFRQVRDTVDGVRGRYWDR